MYFMNCLRSMDFPRAKELRLLKVVVRRKEEPHIGLTCTQVKKVPGVLLCTGCTDYAAQKGWGPFNIVYCRNNEHKELSAFIEEIKKACEKYF